MFCLCLAAGVWAGQQVRNSFQSNRIVKAPGFLPNPATAEPETGLIVAPTGALDSIPTYPVPSVTETPAPLPTSTLPLTTAPIATQPPLPTPTSTAIIEPTQDRALVASPTPAEAVQEIKPGGSQRNILIITVDDLNAETAQLISVWLALYVTGTPHFTLMPVYPAGALQDQPVAPTGDTLAQAFSLNAGGNPSSEFLQVLTERGAWWDATLLLDLTIAENLIDIAYAGEHLPDAGTLQPAFSTHPQDGQDVFLAQAWLGQKFCQNLADPTEDEYPRLLDLFALIPAHLRTDMDLQIVRDELQAIMAQSANIICEIPVLSGGGMEP